MVNYYQCSKAQTILGDWVEDGGSLPALAAYERVFCDGDEEHWRDDVLEKVAGECVELERWYVERTGQHAKVLGEGQSGVIGKLCKQTVDEYSREYLSSLRPGTRVRLMEIMLERRFCIDEFVGTAKLGLVKRERSPQF